MALHRIYYPKDSISESKQKEMASGITNLYSTANIPKFLITVVFIPIDKESFFVGGEVEHKMVQIMSLHYYAPLRKREWQNDFKERFEQAIEPFIREKGYQWQVLLMIRMFLIDFISTIFFIRFIWKNPQMMYGH